MTLLQLEYFLAAAKHGSFSGAADELHLTQPGVSEQVRRLEAELGIPLFNRVGRGVVLTSAGRAFLPRAEEVVGAAARASESMAKLRSMRGGQITFGLFRNADYSILPALCSDFHARHPDVRLRLVGQNSGETAEEVRSGRLDAALVGGPIDPNGLDVVPVVRDEVLYVTAAPERGDRPVTIEELVVAPDPLRRSVRLARHDPAPAREARAGGRGHARADLRRRAHRGRLADGGDGPRRYAGD